MKTYILPLIAAQVMICYCQVTPSPFGPQIFRRTINGFNFHVIETIGTPTPGQSNFRAEQIAEDRYVRGNILYATENELLTFNPATGQTTSIAGGSNSHEQLGRFQGFVQDRYDRVVIVSGGFIFTQDPQLPGNNCLRQVDRRTGRISHLAGVCGSSGYRDGPLHTALFNKPQKIVKDPFRRGIFYVSDTGNQVIRKIDLYRRTVSTFYSFVNSQDFPQAPIAVGIDPRGQYLYVARGTVVGRISFHRRTLEMLRVNPTASENFTPFSDGPLTTAGFAFISGFGFLNSDTVLLADEPNSRLRIIDILSRNVSSVCTGPTDMDGVIDECQLGGFSALAVREDKSGVIFSVNRGFAELSISRSNVDPCNSRGVPVRCQTRTDCGRCNLECCPTGLGYGVCRPYCYGHHRRNFPY